MKPTIAADEMFPEGVGTYMDLEEAGGPSNLLMDLAANEKAVHADFFNVYCAIQGIDGGCLVLHLASPSHVVMCRAFRFTPMGMCNGPFAGFLMMFFFIVKAIDFEDLFDDDDLK